MAEGLVTVAAATVKQWLADNECTLIDVREVKEYTAGHIDGALNRPLTSFDPAAVRAEAPADRKLVVHCQAGGRANQAARQLLGAGAPTVYWFEGSMNAWTQAGYPVVGPPAGSACRTGLAASVQRQMQLTVGSMVLIFTLLAGLVDHRLVWLCLIPAAGLMNAGLTGKCPMIIALTRAPWNK